ncbi:stonustoxin subunit alpha-like isoform X4 [Ctenopharyngodon idella]|uniref:stonustoxin subunit alpha-like isoform X4 n=1 Tax=Ctenopharyngodon idella TaxID=7959 RepID=UPI002231A59C|nr:stonustoxin subunit alpha-like isoform X4 [Ctenopharyngodon idella]XP_051743005.1 stonustoxin subunit alpha-like isoform X4 [Ctenopharyngodon idella]
MSALLMYLKQPSCIYCAYLWLATLAVVNAQEVSQPKPDELQILNEDTEGLHFLADQGNTNNPALESQPIEVAAVGRPLLLGMLYDCRKDTFIPGVTLWDIKSLKKDLRIHSQPMTDLKFSSSDSLSSKSSLLDVSASLKASFLGGLVEVGGSAKYLRDTKSSRQQSRVTMYYKETTRFEELTMSQLGQITYPQVFEQKTATHVVTAVLYGAQAIMVFDRTFSEEKNKQEIEGELDVMVKKIPGFFIEGKGALNMTDCDKKMTESITCTFYGDFHLQKSPTTYMEALEVYKKLPTILKENPKNAVPIKVWLYPLYLLDTKAARLVREISTSLVSTTEDIIEGLGQAERTYNDLSRKTLLNVFRDIKERLKSFQRSFSIYKTMLLKAVSRVFLAIRGGEMEQNSLEDILKIHYSSPFNDDMLNQWLDHAKSELNILSSHTKMLEGIKTEDSDHLNTIILDPNIDVVVCLTFTSLKYEDPYLSTLKEFLKSDKFNELNGEKNMVSVASVRKWFSDPDVISNMKETLSLFKSFSEANKDDKRYRFIMSVIPDPSSPGSSIYLYEKGKLTNRQFQPVSKPPPPEAKEVLDRSVSLKLQKSPTGETVQYRVEYQQVKADSGAEEQWLFKNTSDEDFTLTELEFGKQYLIRYRIVGKVGVSEASGTISSIPPSGALNTFLENHKADATVGRQASEASPSPNCIVPRTRNDFLKYSHQLTLDLNTVNKWIRLSEKNRVITNTDTLQSYPDHPDRFEYNPQVLCRESVCDRRCYWEIEWSGDIVDISVSYKSISRKGWGNKCGFGWNDQSWSLSCSRFSYLFMHNTIETEVPVKPIISRAGVNDEDDHYRTGVYVDHSAGTLSFYSISGDTMILIHTLQTTFTQPLYPGFGVWSGSVKLC